MKNISNTEQQKSGKYINTQLTQKKKTLLQQRTFLQQQIRNGLNLGNAGTTHFKIFCLSIL
jgi:hypothetical protein